MSSTIDVFLIERVESLIMVEGKSRQSPKHFQQSPDNANL